MEAKGISLGWFVPSSSLSPQAFARKAEIEDKQGVQIELIDGEQPAALVIEAGLQG
jgi:hypothetical protein